MEAKEKKLSNEETKKGEITPREEVRVEVLRPAGSVADIVAAYKEYEELKRQLLTDDDWYSVAGQPAKLKRSGWQKLATAFGLEDDIVVESEVQDSKDPMHWTSKITVEARAKNGRTSIGVGACSTREFSWRLDPDGRITYLQPSKRTGQHEVMPLAHFVRSKAHTRAKLRAIADMLGGAEQVEGELEEEPPSQAPTPAARTTQSEGFKGSPQQKIDVGQRAVALNFLKDVLGEDLVKLIRLEEKDGELLVILPAPMREEDRTRFLKAMLVIGQGVHESAKGLVAHMKAPIAVERSTDGSRG
jgi:hypothetical protein